MHEYLWNLLGLIYTVKIASQVNQKNQRQEECSSGKGEKPELYFENNCFNASLAVFF